MTTIDPAMSLGELCDHIVAVHHERLRRDLPQIDELLNSVMRVHGPVHLELRGLPAAFAGLCATLEGHLHAEEQMLFPACRALDEVPGGVPAVDEALLAAREDDHRRSGDALAVLREMTAGYDTGRALCRTHRRLLEALHALELDLHEHMYEEDDVLYPRVRAALDAARSAPR